jgi:hypothetical protein
MASKHQKLCENKKKVLCQALQIRAGPQVDAQPDQLEVFSTTSSRQRR